MGGEVNVALGSCPLNTLPRDHPSDVIYMAFYFTVTNTSKLFNAKIFNDATHVGRRPARKFNEPYDRTGSIE